MFKKIFAVVLFLFVSTGTLYAQGPMDGNSGRPLRGEAMDGPENGERPAPPQFAIDACTGKAEGTECQAGKAGAGVCSYTPDKRYFACKPNNMRLGESLQPNGGPGGLGASDVRQNEDGTITSTF